MNEGLMVVHWGRRDFTSLLEEFSFKDLCAVYFLLIQRRTFAFSTLLHNYPLIALKLKVSFQYLKSILGGKYCIFGGFTADKPKKSVH